MSRVRVSGGFSPVWVLYFVTDKKAGESALRVKARRDGDCDVGYRTNHMFFPPVYRTWASRDKRPKVLKKKRRLSARVHRVPAGDSR